MTTEKLTDAERDVLALNVLALDDAIENAEKRGLSSFVAGLKAILHLAQPAVEKRAPVQGFRGGIPWSMHLEAYDAYCKKWSKQEALITGGCRGGFGTGELDMLIPGWREKLSERAQMVARIVDLTAQVKALEAKLAERGPFVMFDNGDKAFVDSCTGGNHDLGHFGGVTLRFVPVEGDAVVRGYQALDTIKQPLQECPHDDPQAWAAGLPPRTKLQRDFETVHGRELLNRDPHMLSREHETGGYTFVTASELYRQFAYRESALSDLAVQMYAERHMMTREQAREVLTGEPS
jgi:hypothetical protein